MKLYDKVKLKENFKDYQKGTLGIIVEIFDNSFAYLEMIDDDGDTVGMLYDVPLSLVDIV